MEERNTLVEQVLATFETDNEVEARKSLHVAAGMVLSAKQAELPLDETFIERAASAVHDAWLSRNRAHASEEEQKVYQELSEKDKEKDRKFVQAVLAVQ